MTEAQWLRSVRPVAMIEHLGSTVTPRKVRLLLCASCRRLWNAARTEVMRDVLLLAERVADEEIDCVTAERMVEDQRAHLASGVKWALGPIEVTDSFTWVGGYCRPTRKEGQLVAGLLREL